jgi:ubiquitin-like 1-activating enzyme E1 B
MRAPPDISDSVAAAKVLVVGAGGIGCELLKNLVLLGVGHIEVIDMDEIDVSNLNRQFLFRKEHVSQPKAEVAAAAVREFNKDVTIVPHYGNIMDAKYAVEFFERFDVVLNALDNLAARRHVNRICIALDRPLIEAGSTGYLGQASVIVHGETECYECTPKQAPKVYAYCTIRSTPEKPIHCIIWARHLYNLIFGPEDSENMLGDLKDELAALRDGSGVEAAEPVFAHLFDAEIQKQAGLDVWDESGKKRPQALSLAHAKTLREGARQETNQLVDQVVQGVAHYADLFLKTIHKMHSQRGDQIGTLSFTKDDPDAVDFVTAASNLRMWNYHIGLQSRWDVQSLAGAIIPAIATTNAMVAGIQTMHLIKILRNRKASKPLSEGCMTAWVLYPSPSGGKIIMPTRPDKPNPECYVSGSHQVSVTVNSYSEWQLGKFCSTVLVKGMGARLPSVYQERRLIHETLEDGEEPDEDDGMHPEWSLEKWGLSPFGQLLMIEDEAARWSCTLTLREDKELDLEEFPEAYRIDKAAPEPQAEPEKEAEEPPTKKFRAEIEVHEID